MSAGIKTIMCNQIVNIIHCALEEQVGPKVHFSVISLQLLDLNKACQIMKRRKEKSILNM